VASSPRALRDALHEALRESVPEWAEVGPGDPGMALLEGQAWLLWQIMARHELTVERAHAEFRRFLGQTRRPAIPASAVLRFEGPSGVEIPEGSRVQSDPVASGPAVAYALTQSLRLAGASLGAVVVQDAHGVRWLQADVPMDWSNAQGHPEREPLLGAQLALQLPEHPVLLRTAGPGNWAEVFDWTEGQVVPEGILFAGGSVRKVVGRLAFERWFAERLATGLRVGWRDARRLQELAVSVAHVRHEGRRVVVALDGLPDRPWAGVLRLRMPRGGPKLGESGDLPALSWTLQTESEATVVKQVLRDDGVVELDLPQCAGGRALLSVERVERVALPLALRELELELYSQVATRVALRVGPQQGERVPVSLANGEVTPFQVAPGGPFVSGQVLEIESPAFQMLEGRSLVIRLRGFDPERCELVLRWALNDGAAFLGAKNAAWTDGAVRVSIPEGARHLELRPASWPDDNPDLAIVHAHIEGQDGPLSVRLPVVSAELTEEHDSALGACRRSRCAGQPAVEHRSARMPDDLRSGMLVEVEAGDPTNTVDLYLSGADAISSGARWRVGRYGAGGWQWQSALTAPESKGPVRRLRWTKPLSGVFWLRCDAPNLKAPTGLGLNRVVAWNARPVPTAWFSGSGEAFQVVDLQTSGSLTSVPEVHVRTDGQWQAWRVVSWLALSSAQPGERVLHFDRELGCLRFGDGRFGAVPPVGARNIRVQGLLETVEDGNALGAGSLRRLVPPLAGVSLHQDAPSAGGAPAESAEAVAQRAPDLFSHGTRCVTAADFRNAVRDLIGLSGSVAVSAQHGGVVQIVLGCEPPISVDSLRTALQDRAVVGTRVEVVLPCWRDVAVRMNVCPDPGVSTRALLERIDRCVRAWFAAASPSSELAPEALRAAVCRVPGVWYVAAIAFDQGADASQTLSLDRGEVARAGRIAVEWTNA